MVCEWGRRTASWRSDSKWDHAEKQIEETHQIGEQRKRTGRTATKMGVSNFYIRERNDLYGWGNGKLDLYKWWRCRDGSHDPQMTSGESRNYLQVSRGTSQDLGAIIQLT